MDAHLLDILLLARDEQRETALLRLREYLRAHPQDADAWVVLGGLAPDQKLALSALRRAVQLAPENVMARDALAALEAPTIASMPEFPPIAEPVSLELPSRVVCETLPPEPASEPEIATRPADVEPSEAPRVVEMVEAPEVIHAPISQQPASDLVSSFEEATEEAAQSETAWDAEFQALRDARAVVWPFAARGEKNCTLGALLDENRLTRQDLLWAVQEARNEDVRRASQVILDTTHRLADVTMAPEDARLIAWPFRRLNRPLGRLVDAGTVKVKDLRRATWYAKDARLREAARMMLPVALERREAEQRKREAQKERQPLPEQTRPAEPPKSTPVSAPAGKPAKPDPERIKVQAPGVSGKTSRAEAAPDDRLSRPMPVIQGSDYLANEVQRRYRKSAFIAALVLFLTMAGLFVVLAIIVIEFVNRKTPALWLWPLAAVLLLPLFALSDRFVELWQEGQNFRRGQLGESEVARLLRLGLGGDWTLFRNVKLPGSNVDIDMVLLGPPGVFALEVKAYTGNYRYAKQYFYRRSMMTWRRMQHNPGKQARAAAGVLHSYITDTLNEDVWVEPRLVWVGPGYLTLQEPEVFVWFSEKMAQETERLRALPRKLSAEKRAALSGLLRGLCSTLR